MTELPKCKLCSESPRSYVFDGITRYHCAKKHAENTCPNARTDFTEDQWRALMDDSQNINAIANRVCGEIPEGFSMLLCMENGYGGIELFHKGDRVEIDMADWKIHEQVNVALQCIAQIIEEQGNG